MLFDNGKLANNQGFPELRGKGWSFEGHNDLDTCRGYAAAWLNDSKLGWKLEVGKPVDYSGFGDMIEIREVK